MGTSQEEIVWLGERSSLHFDHSKYEVPQIVNGSLINNQITWYVTSPLSVIGLLLNALVLSIWNLKSSRQPIIFLFKVLAVMDMVYIVMFNVWWYSPQSSTFSYIVSGMTFGSQHMLVNITLLVALWRWIGVFRVNQSVKLLTMYRARLAVAIIVGYCAVFQIVEHSLCYFLSDNACVILSIVMLNVLQSLPSLLLVLLMISLSLALRHPQVLPQLSSTGHIHLDSHSNDLTGKVRRLTYTILSITITTFIAYPLSGAVITYYKHSVKPGERRAKAILIGVANLLYVINSTLPFMFYSLFMLKFRKLCLLKFITFYAGNYSGKTASESEVHSSRHPSDMVEGVMQACPYRPSLVVVNEDCTLTISKAPRGSREESRNPLGHRGSSLAWHRGSR
ncbi:hypothetical protein ACOMHN_005589 [Nucella lapillus]